MSRYDRLFYNGHITADEADGAQMMDDDARGYRDRDRCYRRRQHNGTGKPARTINDTTCLLCLEAAGVVNGRQR